MRNARHPKHIGVLKRSSMALLDVQPDSTRPHASRSIFDIDNIDIGPERRAYLEQKLERVWEVNSQVRCCTIHALAGSPV